MTEDSLGYRLKVIDRIMRHLDLTFEAERPPPHQFQQELLMAAEESGEYF